MGNDEEIGVFKVIKIISSNLVAILIFISTIYLLSFVSQYIDYPLLSRVEVFLRNNLITAIYITIFFTFAEIFSSLSYPLNIPSPLLFAVGSIYFVTFILNIFRFIDSELNRPSFEIFYSQQLFIYTIIFVLVLIAGYFSIFLKEYKSGKEKR